MSHRKTKKEKLLAQQRGKKRNQQIIKLQQLKHDLELKIAEQKRKDFKQLNIRNLKVFTNTCNFLAPFVISAGITAGLFELGGGGLPFHSDEITKYKMYHLDFETKGYVTMDEEYRTNRWLDDPLPENSLTIYSPWEKKDNQYVRFKREYDIDSLTTLDLYNAVLDEDYEYIKENLKDYQEEKQVVSEIDSKIPNDYFFEASLHILDKEDVLKYNETDLKNIIITIIELVLGLAIGGVVAYRRDYEYLYFLEEINDSYRCKIQATKLMQQELHETNETILSLTKRKGVKSK